MKTIAFILLFGLSAITLYGQPPHAFKYQAVIRNAAGEIIANQNVNLRINIHNEIPAGYIIYQESHNGTTNQFGLISLNIGLGSPIIGEFGAINWSADSKFMEVEIQSLESGEYYSLGTSELLSVPYAMYSARSKDGYWDLYNSNIYYNSGNVGIRTSTPDADLHVNDRIRIGEDPNYSTVYGELYHNGEGTGFVINSNAGGGSWADIYFQTNATTRMFIESAGNVGIGTTNLASGYRLSVDGKIACEEVLVEYSNNWPDYVFDENYKLLPLEELELNIKKNKHLPGLPSAQDVESSGFHLAEMQKNLLEKVEELTLYTIQQGKLIKNLQYEVNLLIKENRKLKESNQLK